MSVEEIFVINQIIVVTELHESFVGVALTKSAQSRMGQPVKRPPQNLMLGPSHIDKHTSV